MALSLTKMARRCPKSIGNVITPSQLLDGGGGGEGRQVGKVGGNGKAGGKGGVRRWQGCPGCLKERKQARQAQAQAPYGVDVLRLWVAMSDWRADVAVGDTVLSKARESYRRLRLSCRFILGNLHDFDVSADALPLHELRVGDRYAAPTCRVLWRRCASHDQHTLSRVVESSALVLASESLSGRYFDATKDRLYCGEQAGASRRAVQTVLYHTLDRLLLAIQPLVPFGGGCTRTVRSRARRRPSSGCGSAAARVD